MGRPHEAFRSRHYSRRTEQAYCCWAKRFIYFHSIRHPVQDHLKKVKAIHERDLAQGWGCVQMPMALDRKYPNAPAEWRWQWVFPQENRWINPQIKQQGRHHTMNRSFRKRCATRSQGQD